jgi:hypothetical protein
MDRCFQKVSSFCESVALGVGYCCSPSVHYHTRSLNNDLSSKFPQSQANFATPLPINGSRNASNKNTTSKSAWANCASARLVDTASHFQEPKSASSPHEQQLGAIQVSSFNYPQSPHQQTLSSESYEGGAVAAVNVGSPNQSTMDQDAVRVRCFGGRKRRPQMHTVQGSGDGGGGLIFGDCSSDEAGGPVVGGIHRSCAIETSVHSTAGNACGDGVGGGSELAIHRVTRRGHVGLIRLLLRCAAQGPRWAFQHQG